MKSIRLLTFFSRYLVVLTLLILPAVSPAADSATVYQCDQQGKISFQDTPCPQESQTRSIRTASSPAAGRSASEHPSDTGTKSCFGNDRQHYTPFFWEAKRDGLTLYLMGSIHLGNADLYPLPGYIMQRFEQADALVVEADINQQPAAATQLLMQHGMLPPGQTLFELLDPQQQALLKQTLTRLAIPSAMLQQQRPWMAATFLSVFALKSLGYHEQYGIDLFFLKHADNKKIIELESIEQQTQLMARLPQSTQIAMLEETARVLQQPQQYYHALIQAWCHGNETRLEQMIQPGFGNDAHGERLKQVLLYQRNQQMIQKLRQLNGRHFVVVGAAHLTGPEGIVAQLKQHGFTLHPFQ